MVLVFHAYLLNSPIAHHSVWSVGAVKIWHLLVVVKGKDSPNNIVTLGHKARLEAALKHAYFCCKLCLRGESRNLVTSYSKDTDRVKQGR